MQSLFWIVIFRPLETEKDCNSALNLEPNCIKALYRRGMARKQLFRYNLASNDFKQVLSLEDNKEAQRELQSIQRLIESKSVVNIEPIDKSKEFQSNKPLVKIKIIDKNDELNQIVIKLPEKVPQNYFQFECDWRLLDDKNSRHLRPKYLKMIGCESIEMVLTSTLEPRMMSSLLDAISDLDDPLLTYEILKQISKTPRFSTNLLFMSNEDKQVLSSIFDKLRANKLEDKFLKEIEAMYLS